MRTIYRSISTPFYKTRKVIVSAGLAVISFWIAGCAASGFRFADKAPVWDLNDRSSIPMPKKANYIRADYYFKILVRRPAISLFDCAPVERSRDVNALDQVPRSSWYTPRLGYRDITPEMLVNGPTKVGPPVRPVRVVKAKSTGSNPGFFIVDSRDQIYLIKFDPPSYPAVETTTAFIVNRLFWGFGYNVPEDHTFYFYNTQIPVDPTTDITDEEVNFVFSEIAPPINGVYRATASLYLDTKGALLGPISDTGTRKDDPNDRFPHEKLRILRALKVFGAFTNHTDISIDNTLDIYLSQKGERHVEHYLLDFGEALGAHGTERSRLWDGFVHVFSFGEMFRNIATLGLKVQDWENIGYTQWKSVGSFEADYFDPLTWKEAYPFEPIQQSQAEDCYWAAKIVASITREHLAALADSANYPEPEAATYVVETLLKRRQKIIDAHFARVSPIEYESLNNRTIRLSDYGKIYGQTFQKTAYTVRFFNDGTKELTTPRDISGAGETFEIALDDGLFEQAGNYIRLEIQVHRDGAAAPRAAQFHLIRRANGDIRLAGVVH